MEWLFGRKLEFGAIFSRYISFIIGDGRRTSFWQDGEFVYHLILHYPIVREL
jgi:hypothetical protein